MILTTREGSYCVIVAVVVGIVCPKHAIRIRIRIGELTTLSKSDSNRKVWVWSDYLFFPLQR